MRRLLEWQCSWKCWRTGPALRPLHAAGFPESLPAATRQRLPVCRLAGHGVGNPWQYCTRRNADPA